MQKISTQTTTSVKTEKKAKKEEQLLPSPSVISNILAYSKALKVTKSEKGTLFTTLVN
jgi:hypothetical protein